MAKVYADTFNRANGNIAGSTSSDTLFTWTAPLGSPQVISNQAGHVSGGDSEAIASADCDSDAIYAQIDYVSGSAFWLDVSQNTTYPNSGSNGYEAAVHGGVAELYAIASGGFSLLQSVSHSASAGTYRLERNGSSIVLKRNGTTVVSATDSSEPTGAGNRKAGWGCADSAVLDNFGYGDIVTGNTISVPTGSLTLTGFAPTIVQTANNVITVPLGTLTLTGQTPTIVAGGNQVVSVPLGTLTLTGLTPTVVATSTSTSYHVDGGNRPRPGRGPFSVGRFFVSTPDAITQAHNTISVPLATMTLTANAPTVVATANNFIAVPLGTLTLTGQTPTVTATAHNVVAVPLGSLTLTGFEPTVQNGANNIVAVPLGTMTLTGNAPTVVQSANRVIDVPLGSLTINGFAPTVTASDHQLIAVPAGSVTLTGIAPSVNAGGPQVIDVPLGVLTITAYAPDVLVSQPASEQFSGGLFFAYEREREKVKARRRKQLEDEEEIERLEAVDREIAVLLQKQEAKEAEKKDFERLSRLAAQFADKQAQEAYSDRIAKAIARVNATQSAAALAHLQIEIERQLREEEQALIFFLNQ